MELQRETRWIKDRIKFIHYDFEDFSDFDTFSDRLLENLKVGEQYSLLIKIKFNGDRYGMGGDQVGFDFSESENVEYLEFIHNSFMSMIRIFIDDYDVGEINLIELLYVTIKDLPKLKLKNINKVKLNKEFVNVKEIKDRFNFLPLTLNTSYYGKLIVENIPIYLDIINKQKSLLNKEKLSLDDLDSMYLYNDKYIIIIKQDGNIYHRSIYESKSGILISKVIDTFINEDVFLRSINNVTLTVSNGKVTKVESIKKLSPIKSSTLNIKDEPNPFIGSWDIETFEDLDGYSRVYALGFVVSGEKPRTYYLNDNISSNKLVLDCINDMLDNKYNGYTFYCHNFGRYDSKYLLKVLKDENLKRGYEHYILKSRAKDNNLLKLEIRVKRVLSDKLQSVIGARKNPGYNKVTIVDSLNLLNDSLDRLCRCFDVEVVKGKFPYRFVRRDTLNYIGNIPGYEYWDNTNLSEYNELYNKVWNLKQECLKYLEKDLISLLMIMQKFSEYINRKYYLQVTDCLTISRLALNIFFKDYLKDSKLPIIRKGMFSDIKEAYYGGVTEVYKPYGEDLYLYDVNSLYPFAAALNPMPGTECTYVENLDGGLELKNLYGFFYCEVETSNNYLGLLPVHDKLGLIMPNGKWKGWYYSEELKYAARKGYKINIIKGYNFNKVENVFRNYVDDLYHVKSNTKDPVERAIIKRLLNHLLGRFGMNISKPISDVVDEDELGFIWRTRKINTFEKINNEDWWVTYNPEVNKEICESHGLDYFEVCNLTSKTDIERVNEFSDVSLTTAAAVTSLARIFMAKVKVDIMKKGGKLYYTDTDSIVTNIPLDDWLVGEKLGQFKLEYKINKGYFISNKLYCLILEDGSQIIKSKTVKSNSLTLENFEMLYKGVDVKAIKRDSKTIQNEGCVLIYEKPVTLNHDSYTKREKVYNKGKWIDTKPLNYNPDYNLESKKIIKNKVIKKKRPLWNKLIKLYHLTSKILSILFWFIIVSLLIIFYIETKLNEDINTYNELNPTMDNICLDYINTFKESPVKSYFDSFINLFKKREFNHEKLILKEQLNKPVIFNESINEEVNNINGERISVLNEILLHHIKEFELEVHKLNKEISLQELEIIKYRIDRLDTLNLVNKTLNEWKELKDSK